MLEAQQRAMMHVAERVPFTPRVLRAASGDDDRACAGQRRTRRISPWAITWLSGRPLGAIARHSPELLRGLRTQRRRAAAMRSRTSTTPAIHRDFYWDLANGRAIVSRYRSLVADAALGRGARHAHRAASTATPRRCCSSLPRAAIHGDSNDYNVLVGGDGDVECARSARDAASSTSATWCTAIASATSRSRSRT